MIRRPPRSTRTATLFPYPTLFRFVADAIGQLDPRRTLVIIASKSFTTTEPLANAEVAINWLRDAGVADPVKHVVAVTANVDAALDFGISPEDRKSTRLNPSH